MNYARSDIIEDALYHATVSKDVNIATLNFVCSAKWITDKKKLPFEWICVCGFIVLCYVSVNFKVVYHLFAYDVYCYWERNLGYISDQASSMIFIIFYLILYYIMYFTPGAL